MFRGNRKPYAVPRNVREKRAQPLARVRLFIAGRARARLLYRGYVLSTLHAHGNIRERVFDNDPWFGGVPEGFRSSGGWLFSKKTILNIDQYRANEIASFFVRDDRPRVGIPTYVFRSRCEGGKGVIGVSRYNIL